ncbi:MAG: type II toxin-antitoxin system VapC family toxin [Candidatus Bathyarchaeota archaeon]|nr:type II toxin-antitoxin system VapC family toxin [Candidatus Bathyarchaeota archaeon]
MAGKTYLDVNVFVYWITDSNEFGEDATRWIKQIGENPQEYITSSLTIYETAIVIAGQIGKTLKDTGFINQLNTAFSSLINLDIIPLTAQQLIEAPILMQEYKLDFEDAIHLNSALDNNATQIVSNDKDFDRTPLTRLF